jgi:murein DD-endopeptidase MepM/ murein hydrolase activator NlpD
MFRQLPSDEPLRLAWPTPNRSLRTEPGKYFARTRVNPDYGRPGWTRECGKRLHRGCDIAPVEVTATGQTTTVMFTDCATGREYPSEEPTFVPHDEVYAVYDGEIVEMVDDESVSDFGRHMVIRHRWLASGEPFYTLYAHLAEIGIGPSFAKRRASAGKHSSSVIGGQKIGVMGRSSKSADARNWMAIAPHLHFEVWDGEKQPYDPAEFLQRYLRG